jgi:predicted DCC family thiol-disulfide oxidoreductase YuxK
MSTQPTTSDQQKALVLYDGQCAFCRKSIAILKKLDWLGALRYQDGRDVERLPKTDPPLEPARLLDEMHLVPPSGRPVYHGFGAFRWMSWRLPLCWLIAPFLYIPGVPWLGNKVYLWIARNRLKLVPCKDGICELPARVAPPKP